MRRPAPRGAATVVRIATLVLICILAVSIRIFTPVRYTERVIHEYDPYFNLRVAEYIQVRAARGSRVLEFPSRGHEHLSHDSKLTFALG